MPSAEITSCKPSRDLSARCHLDYFRVVDRLLVHAESEVLAPTSCTLIFSSQTRSRLAPSNDRRPLPKKYRQDINMKLVDESRIQDLLGYAPSVTNVKVRGDGSARKSALGIRSCRLTSRGPPSRTSFCP